MYCNVYLHIFQEWLKANKSLDTDIIEEMSLRLKECEAVSEAEILPKRSDITLCDSSFAEAASTIYIEQIQSIVADVRQQAWKLYATLLKPLYKCAEKYEGDMQIHVISSFQPSSVLYSRLATHSSVVIIIIRKIYSQLTNRAQQT